MTPREKADELIRDFENVELLDEVGGMDIELARQCAVIAVEKIIPLLFSDYRGQMFWEDVKRELENNN